jgi:hypothetical protein
MSSSHTQICNATHQASDFVSLLSFHLARLRGMRTLLRYRWWLVVAVLLCGVGSLAFRLLCPPPARLTHELFDRIRLGVSEAELREYMQVAPGDYAAIPAWLLGSRGDGVPTWLCTLIDEVNYSCTVSLLTPPADKVLQWRDDVGLVTVQVYKGRINGKSYVPAWRRSEQLANFGQHFWEKVRSILLVPRW